MPTYLHSISLYIWSSILLFSRYLLFTLHRSNLNRCSTSLFLLHEDWRPYDIENGSTTDLSLSLSLSQRCAKKLKNFFFGLVWIYQPKSDINLQYSQNDTVRPVFKPERNYLVSVLAQVLVRQILVILANTIRNWLLCSSHENKN